MTGLKQVSNDERLFLNYISLKSCPTDYLCAFLCDRGSPQRPSAIARGRINSSYSVVGILLSYLSVVVLVSSYGSHCHFDIFYKRGTSRREQKSNSAAGGERGSFLVVCGGCDMSCLVPRFVELGLTLTLTMLVLGHMKNNGRPFSVKKFFKRSWRAYW